MYAQTLKSKQKWWRHRSSKYKRMRNAIKILIDYPAVVWRPLSREPLQISA